MPGEGCCRGDEKTTMIVDTLRNFYWFLSDVETAMKRVGSHAAGAHRVMYNLIAGRLSHMTSSISRVFGELGLSLGEKPSYEEMTRQLGEVSLEALDDLSTLFDAVRRGGSRDEVARILLSIKEKLEISVGITRLILKVLREDVKQSYFSRSLAMLVSSLRWDLGFMLSVIEEELEEAGRS